MSKTNDEWNLALDIKIKELQKCQQQMGLKSCTPCEKLLDCELRNKYVKAVYESMNKGSGGGFEF